MYNTDWLLPFIVDKQRRDIDIIRDIDLPTVVNWNVYEGKDLIHLEYTLF